MSASGQQTPFVSNIPRSSFLRAPPSTRISSPVFTARTSTSTPATAVDWEAKYNTANQALSRRNQQLAIANSRIQSLNRELDDKETELAAKNRDIVEMRANLARADEWTRAHDAHLRWMDMLFGQRDRELASARQTITELLVRNARLLSNALETRVELMRVTREHDAEKERRTPTTEDATSPLGRLVNRVELLLAELETLKGKDRDAEEYDADVDNVDETTKEDEAISSGYIDVSLGGAWRG
jgi:chromosome segregation ATPase